MEHYDLVVVGGGPAGAVTACTAAHGGAKVLVLERSPHRPPRCTGLVGPELLNLLSVPPRFVLRKLRALRVHAPSGRSVEIRAAGPKGYVLDRSGLDRWLLGGAAEAGARVAAPVAAVGVSGQVLHTTAGPVGFDLLVGADGAESAVRRWAGLPPPAEVLAGVQAVVNPVPPTEDDAVEVHLGHGVAPGGFAWVVPAEDGLLRVGLLTTSRREASALLVRFLACRYPQAQVIRRESGLVPIGAPARTAKERVVLVGDAAGQVKPLTGGGILFGAVSAKIVGEAVSHGPEGLLEYESRWRGELGAEIAFGLLARRAFLSRSDTELDRIVAALDCPEVRSLIAAEGDLDRPSQLARAVMARPTLWPALIPLARAWGGWSRVREVSLGLSNTTEAG